MAGCRRLSSLTLDEVLAAGSSVIVQLMDILTTNLLYGYYVAITPQFGGVRQAEGQTAATSGLGYV
jgi:hypothetical protein